MKNYNLFYVAIVAVIVMFTACESKEGKEEGMLMKKGLTCTKLTLEVGEQKMLEYKGDDGNVEWRCDKNIVAVVNDGVVTGKLAGKTKIYANDDVCDVEVLPSYTLFLDPCLRWGAGIETVMGYMYLYDEALVKKDEKTLMYNTDGPIKNYMYSFENGGLANVGVLASTYYNDEIIRHFKDRYIMVDENLNEDVFYFTDYTMEIMIMLKFMDVNNMMIVYIPVPNDVASVRACAETVCVDEIQKLMNR